jgi:hypothetical protein
MQKWLRSGLLSVGLAGAMVGGGAMVAQVAHAQSNDSSSSSSTTDNGSSSTTGNGSSSTTAPAQGTAPGPGGMQGDCPNM